MNDNPPSFGRWQFGISNCKCFGDETQFVNEIKKINVVVGKNNSGKTTVLDFFDCMIAGNPIMSRNGEVSYALATTLITEEDRSRLPLSQTYISQQTGARLSERALFDGFLVGSELTMRIAPKNWSFQSLKLIRDDLDKSWCPMADRVAGELGVAIGHPFTSCRVIRISAERNVISENRSASFQGQLIKSNGQGLTSFLEFIDSRGIDNLRSKIDELLVPSLNRLLDDADKISRLHLRRQPNDAESFEIVFTRQSSPARDIRLSDCGSGLRTLIQVLVSLLFLPSEMAKTDKYSTNFFLFEELENNMHPSTLRRLLHFIDHFVTSTQSFMVLATHSPVVIDTFAKVPHAQILHVVRNKDSSAISRVDGWLGSNKVLDDIGVRASDMLQSNCIIWIEGPSDMVYLKKWIELWTDKNLQHNVHYQCLIYGGQTGDYLSADAAVTDEVIACLRINRNVVFFGDSDRTKEDELDSARCQRIREEIKKSGRGICWITDGRETENYIPTEIVSEICKHRVSTDKFSDVPALCGQYSAPKRKTLLADATLPYWRREHLINDQHLNSSLAELVAFVCECNDIENRWTRPA